MLKLICIHSISVNSARITAARRSPFLPDPNDEYGIAFASPTFQDNVETLKSFGFHEEKVISALKTYADMHAALDHLFEYFYSVYRWLPLYEKSEDRGFISRINDDTKGIIRDLVLPKETRRRLVVNDIVKVLWDSEDILAKNRIEEGHGAIIEILPHSSKPYIVRLEESSPPAAGFQRPAHGHWQYRRYSRAQLEYVRHEIGVYDRVVVENGSRRLSGFVTGASSRRSEVQLQPLASAFERMITVATPYEIRLLKDESSDMNVFEATAHVLPEDVSYVGTGDIPTVNDQVKLARDIAIGGKVVQCGEVGYVAGFGFGLDLDQDNSPWQVFNVVLPGPVYYPLQYHEIEYVFSLPLLSLGDQVVARFDIPKYIQFTSVVRTEDDTVLSIGWKTFPEIRWHKDGVVHREFYYRELEWEIIDGESPRLKVPGKNGIASEILSADAMHNLPLLDPFIKRGTRGIVTNVIADEKYEGHFKYVVSFFNEKSGKFEPPIISDGILILNRYQLM